LTAQVAGGTDKYGAVFFLKKNNVSSTITRLFFKKEHTDEERCSGISTKLGPYACFKMLANCRTGAEPTPYKIDKFKICKGPNVNQYYCTFIGTSEARCAKTNYSIRAKCLHQLFFDLAECSLFHRICLL
jgi:hypothetical protein